MEGEERDGGVVFRKRERPSSLNWAGGVRTAGNEKGVLTKRNIPFLLSKRGSKEGFCGGKKRNIITQKSHPGKCDMRGKKEKKACDALGVNR